MNINFPSASHFIYYQQMKCLTAMCFSNHSFPRLFSIWNWRIKDPELTIPLDVSCIFSTKQKGTFPWFNFEMLPFQNSLAPKRLFKNDSGDNSKHYSAILPELFLAPNFSHALSFT